jgi:dTMP kinase
MFISFEGIEGSGKTTQIGYAAEFLKEQGVACLLTREPGGTPIGARVRSILLDPLSKGIDPLAELLLYMADRAQHLSEVVKTGIDAGKTVLCDRFFDATLVYQGYARGLDVAMIAGLHRQAFDDIHPDLTLLLDLPPEKGLKRAWRQIDSGGRSAGETRFEEEKIAFHEKVRQGYLTLAGHEPQRFVIIDASRDEEGVRAQICAALSRALPGIETGLA